MSKQNNTIIKSELVYFKFSDNDSHSSNLISLYQLLKSKFQSTDERITLEFFQNLKNVKLLKLKGSAYSVDISKDEKIIIISHGPHFDVMDGKCFSLIRSINVCHNIRRAVISSDNKYAIVAADSKNVLVFDLRTGKLYHKFIGHTSSTWSAATGNGSIFATGGQDRSIILWCLEKKKKIMKLIGHKHTVRSLSFSNDDKRLISGCWDSTVKIWDTENGMCLRTLKGHSNLVLSVCFSKFGNFVVSSSYDSTIKIWSYTGECLKILKGHSHAVEYVMIVGNDKYIISAGDDELVKVWDVETGEKVRTFEGHTSAIWSFCLRKSYLITCDLSGNVIIWK